MSFQWHQEFGQVDMLMDLDGVEVWHCFGFTCDRIIHGLYGVQGEAKKLRCCIDVDSLGQLLTSLIARVAVKSEFQNLWCTLAPEGSPHKVHLAIWEDLKGFYTADTTFILRSVICKLPWSLTFT